MFSSHYVQCYSKKDQKWKPGLLKGRDEHGRYVITVRDAHPDSPGIYNPKIDAEANDGNYIEKEIVLYPTLIRDSLEPWVIDDRVPPPTFTWNLEDRMAASLAANRKQREEWAASQKAAIEESEKKAADRDSIRKQMNATRFNGLQAAEKEIAHKRSASRSSYQKTLADKRAGMYSKIEKNLSSKEQSRQDNARAHNQKVQVEKRRRESARRKTLDKDAEEKKQIAGTYEKINQGIAGAEASRQDKARKHARIVSGVDAEKAQRRKSERERLSKQKQKIDSSYAKISEGIGANERKRAEELRDRESQIQKLNREKEERRQKELQRQAEQQENTGASYKNISSNLDNREKARKKEQSNHVAVQKKHQAAKEKRRQKAMAQSAQEQEAIAKRYAGVSQKINTKENNRRKGQSEHAQAVRTHQARIAKGRQEAVQASAEEQEKIQNSYSMLNDNLTQKEAARQKQLAVRARELAAQRQKIRDNRQARREKEATALETSVAQTYKGVADRIAQKQSSRQEEQTNWALSRSRHQVEIQKRRQAAIEKQMQEKADGEDRVKLMNDGITKKQSARFQEQQDMYQQQREHQARISAGREAALEQQAKQNAAVAAQAQKVKEGITAKEAARQKQNRGNMNDFKTLEDEQAKKRQARLEQNEKDRQKMASTYNNITQGIGNKEGDKRAAEAQTRQQDGENNLSLLKRKSDQNDQERKDLEANEARRQDYKAEKSNARDADRLSKMAAEEQLRVDVKAKRDVPGKASLFGSGATVSPRHSAQADKGGMVPPEHAPLSHQQLRAQLVYNTPCDIYSTKTQQWVSSTYLAFDARTGVYRTRLPNGRTVIAPRNRIRPSSGEAKKVYADAAGDDPQVTA